MSFLITHSGIKFDLVNPAPEMVNIEDIAVSLSRTARFNGHTKEFYSVAQHCVLVSKIVESTHPELALAALLHDAAEAYVGDLISPIKRQVLKFACIEGRVAQAIGGRFGVSLEPVSSAVKHADLQALACEASQYMGVEDLSDWYPEGLPDPEWALEDPLPPAKAREAFLGRFHADWIIRRIAA